MNTVKKAVSKAAEARKKAKAKSAQKTGGNQTGGNQAGRNQITGNIGLYYVCMRLSAMGLNAILTARNTVGVDILVNNSDSTGNNVAIQVKTASNQYAVLIGRPGKRILGDIWVVVANADKVRIGEDPLCFVIRADKVEEKRRGGKAISWLSLGDFEQDAEAWEQIQDAIDSRTPGSGVTSIRARARKAQAELAVNKIWKNPETSERARCRDALLFHFVYVEGRTFRKVHAMKVREVARMTGIPQNIREAAQKVEQWRGRGSVLICQNNGKPYRRWEVLAGMGSRLKRLWMGE